MEELPVEARTDTAQPASESAESLLPEDLDEEIIEVFFEEADEILESMDQSANDWAKEPVNHVQWPFHSSAVPWQSKSILCDIMPF